MFYACFTPIALCFVYTLWHFYVFSETNLLTRCLMRRGVDSFSPSSWEPQEEGMMSTAASFFPQKETKVYRIQEKVNTPEGDAR
jgi:hypothetical protein